MSESKKINPDHVVLYSSCVKMEKSSENSISKKYKAFGDHILFQNEVAFQVFLAIIQSFFFFIYTNSIITDLKIQGGRSDRAEIELPNCAENFHP